MHSPALPQLGFVMDLHVELHAPVELGVVEGTNRRVIPIAGGSFAGPGLAGRILPGGADWQIIRPDGVALLDARYTLETSAGDLIALENRGFRHGAEDLAERLGAGEEVPPSEYYFLTTPTFHTSATSLQWLTRTIFLAQGERRKNYVLLHVFQVEG